MAFGDVLWANLPLSGGHTQAGTRTAILVQCDDDDAQLNTRTVVPMTTTLAVLRFPGTILVNPTAANGLTDPSVLMACSVTTLDKSRVGGKRGQLDPPDQAALKKALQAFFQLP